MKLSTTLKAFALIAMSALIAGQSFAISEEKKQAIAERIKPVGELCFEGDTSCAGASAAASSGPKDPADVYASTCAGCHDTGAGGAPKVGAKADWTARIAQGDDKLYSNAIGGVGAMPPKGLCMDCSDDDIKAIVDLMVSKSK